MNRRIKAFRGDAETLEEDLLVESQYEIKTNACGYLNVFVKGRTDLQDNQQSPVFLTLHDLGTNHQDFHKLLEHPCMAKVMRRSVWIHVDMPGQEYDAIDLAPFFEFPTYDQICEDLVQVLEYFEIESCVTFGEGAGANILLRFSQKFPEKVMGNILINCKIDGEGLIEKEQGKLVSWSLRVLGMNKMALKYFVQHKFGIGLKSNLDIDAEQAIEDYESILRKSINPKNLRQFLKVHLRRSDLNKRVAQVTTRTLIVSGSAPTMRQAADKMQNKMNSDITTRIDLENCISVLDQAPDIFANKMILFCQGIGLRKLIEIV